MATMNNNNNNARNATIATLNNSTLPPVIPLMPSPDRVMITYTVKDKDEKRTVTIAPITSSTVDASNIIPHVAQFYTFTSHTWQEEKSRFNLFSLTLQDIVAHGKWKSIEDVALATVEKDKTKTLNIKACLKKFVAHYANSEQQEAHIEYMRQGIVKTIHNTVMDLDHQIDMLNSYVEWFPGNLQPLKEDERKSIFYKAMPQKWKTHFSNAGRSALAETRQKIAYFMKMQEYNSNQA
jgi:hypothetical protein